MNRNRCDDRWVVTSRAQLGARAILYANQRATSYLSGITGLKELLLVLHTVTPPCRRLTPRGQGTSGWNSRRPRIGG
jgi:hypothetical protein